MACFLVPAAEAIAATIAERALASGQKTPGEGGASCPDGRQGAKAPFSRKLRWLNHMLWGGSALLALEHLWHGEMTLRFPFLTALGEPADTAAMFREMATAGVAMAALVTLVWGGMVLVSNAKAPKHDMKIGVLALMCWGGALMWLVDAAFAWAKPGSAPGLPEVLGDLCLGLSFAALGLVIRSIYRISSKRPKAYPSARHLSISSGRISILVREVL